MKKIILLIDSRYIPSESFLRKAAMLAKKFRSEIDVLMDTRKTLPKRWYWSDIFSENKLNTDTALQLQRVTEAVDKTLRKEQIRYQLSNIQSADIANVINQIAVKDESYLLMIDAQLQIKKHPIITQLKQLKIPVFICINRDWHEPIELAAAIDPFHENETIYRTDSKIIKKLQLFEKLFSSKGALLNSCYVPPIAIDHRKHIFKVHEEELKSIASSHNIKFERISLLKGLPEESLSRFAVSENIDILIVGLLAREEEDRQLGSTSSSLIEHPPCDLLLLP